MDLTTINKELLPLTILKAEIDKIGLNCQQIRVVDESTLAVAQQNLSKASNIASDIEAKRKSIKQPYLDGGKLVDSTAKSLIEGLEKGMASVKSEIAAWEKKRLADAAEKQRQIEANIAILSKDIKSEGEVAILNEMASKELELANLEALANKTKNVRYTWGFEIDDYREIPDEWKSLDVAIVKDYLSKHKDKLKDGEVINGVRFYKNMSIVA
jgi:hypothetical protein